MREKFLEEALVGIVGKPGEKLVIILDTKKYINEFIISKNLDLTINQVRNLLYKIADNGLVSFERKKDKKKGWYTYFWKIEPLKVFEFLMANLQKRIEHIKEQIKLRTEKQYYICERCSIEVDDVQALQMDFACPECGEIFTARDNSKVLKELNRVLVKLQEERQLLEKEINIEKEKIGKEIGKAFTKFKKDKALKRQQAKKIKEKSEKKEIKKSVREKIKKPTKKTLKKPLKKSSKKNSKK